MRAIFISYRRDDSEGHAGRLYDDLVRQFGDGSVFMDVAGIEPGIDFRKVIDKNVSSCGVLLALIGPAWLDAKDEDGHRRLDNPMDFVRLETAAALKRDIPVVPVLVSRARMPRPEQLPDDLKELTYRNAVELTHARWDTDVQVLVKALRRHIDTPPSEGVRSSVRIDPAQGRAVEKTTPPAKIDGADTPPPDRPRRPTKSWRTLVVLVGAAVAIAAGIGYASYEYRKASSEEDAKVRQAAADAAASQRAQDEKAVADREAARKAAADRETAQKTAADRETTNKAASQPVASSTPHVTVGTTNCLANGSGQYKVSVSGVAQVPPAETYGLYAEIYVSQGGLRWRPACRDWGPAQQADGGLWQVSCVHRSKDSPQTEFEVTGIASAKDGNPPSGGGIGTYRFDIDKKGPFTNFSLNCPSSAEAQQSGASVPNFAGTWELIDNKHNGKQQSVANAKPLVITQNGNLVRIGREMPITKDGTVTYKTFAAQDNQAGHAVETEAEAALVDTFTWKLEGSILVFETTLNYKAPYFGHQLGTELRIMRYRRVSP